MTLMDAGSPGAAWAWAALWKAVAGGTNGARIIHKAPLSVKGGPGWRAFVCVNRNNSGLGSLRSAGVLLRVSERPKTPEVF